MQLLLEGGDGGGCGCIWRVARRRGSELAEIQGDLAVYAHTVDMHSPPAQARERLMKQVAREKKAIPMDRRGGGDARAPETSDRGGSVFSEPAAASRGSSEAYYKSVTELAAEII